MSPIPLPGSSALLTRRALLRAGAALAGAGAMSALAGCEKAPDAASQATARPGKAKDPNEEYVWLSAAANLPLFVAHDHRALRLVGKELGVKVSIAGPDRVDISALVATIEQTAARRPAGLMVVGWDASALVPAINQAIASGVPVVCVDADVPASNRLAFIGTDWFDLGVRQAEAMVRALAGRRGKIALLGLVDQAIDVAAFAGFRSVAKKAGLICLDPLHDKASQAEAARVASAVIQAHPDMVGMAGFDSDSGPGIGQAIREARRTGSIIATCVDAEPQHLQLVQEGVLAAAIGQKRELFTYMGVKALYEFVHSHLRFTADDRAAGIAPIPIRYDTGTYTVTRDNVHLFARA